MVDVDDPGHRVQRSVIEKMLTPSAVSKHSEYVTAVIDIAVKGIIGAGSVEVVNAIAQTLPVTFIGSLLGVRDSDFPLLRKWGEAMVEGADGWENVTEEVVEAVINWFDYFDDLSKTGYWDDKEGIISLLLNASKENGSITYEEARGNSLAILIGGNETAKYLLSGAIDLYVENPDIATIYKDVGPEKFINEVLRYLSPVVSSARRTTTDVAVGENIIPAGAQVMLFLTSANMDESVFENPELFNPARNSSAHLSLGFGPHFCIGASLAKIQLQALFEYFINNKIKITKDESAPMKFKYSTFLRGIKEMRAFVEKN
jgi:cytochrome P450 family 142 subfamily A polypeptide 1